MAYADEVLADSPLAYYRLGEASGTVAADSSGNGRDGTYVNTPTLGVTGLLAGDTNKAMQLTNDTAQHVSIPHGAWMDGSTLVVELLYKQSILDNYGAMAARYPTSNAPWYLTVNPTGKIEFTAKSSDGSALIDTKLLTSPSALVNGTTYHVAARVTVSSVDLFIDGTQVATTTRGYPLFAHVAGQPITIGRFLNTNEYTPGAVIDEVALYSSLSSTRIAAHAAAAVGTVPTITGTLAATLPGPLS